MNLFSVYSKVCIICITIFFLTALAIIVKGYEISGKISAANGTMIKLNYSYHGKDIADSVSIQQNSFLLKGKFPEIVLCTLSNSTNQQIKMMVAGEQIIRLSGSIDRFSNLDIQGAADNELYDAFKANSMKISGDYRRALQSAGADRHDHNSPLFVRYRERIDSLTIDFVNKHNRSAVSALVIIDSYINNNYKREAENSYQRLSNDARSSIYSKRIKQFIETENNISKGKQAPDFELKSSGGRKIQLANYKGQYIFLDFWASWCPPCRAEHPLLRLLQKEYAKNLTFISISMDTNQASWKNAVNVDQLTWLQLNDPKSINGEMADKYGIKSLPFNCLIDPEGKIIAKNLRGDNLQVFLSHLFP